MTSTKPSVKFLDWLAEIVDGSEVVHRKVSEITTLPTGTQFSVSGEVIKAGYLYVVQVSGHEIAVLYPESNRTDHEDAGTATLRLPSGDQRFTALIDGAVYVVDANRPVSNSEWPSVFPGRDPPPETHHLPT